MHKNHKPKVDVGFCKIDKTFLELKMSEYLKNYLDSLCLKEYFEKYDILLIQWYISDSDVFNKEKLPIQYPNYFFIAKPFNGKYYSIGY